MADWESGLPPIMRERLAKIGEMGPEEKARLKDSEQLTSILSEFYAGNLDADGLWKRLKQYRDSGKVSVLKEAQAKLLDSFSPAMAPAEFKHRKDGILAIETLKTSQNTSVLEQGLRAIEDMQARRKQEMEQAYNSVKARVEHNPQLRMQQVKQGRNTVVMQLTVDEAIKINPEWKNFVMSHERHYNEEFTRAIAMLQRMLEQA